jgi:hypothetical protein
LIVVAVVVLQRPCFEVGTASPVVVVGSMIELATHGENGSTSRGDALGILPQNLSAPEAQVAVCCQLQRAYGDSSLERCVVNVADIDAEPPALAGSQLCLGFHALGAQNHGKYAAGAGLECGPLMARAAEGGAKADVTTARAADYRDVGVTRPKSIQHEDRDVAVCVGTKRGDVEAGNAVR